MADTRLLPAGINDERGRVLLSLIDRLGEIDLSKMLIYRLQDLADNVLVNLAWQFHVMGNEGWGLVSTEQQQLDLIRRAIDIHRYRGTRWAMEQAFDSIGFSNARVVELSTLRDDYARDHLWFLDGSATLDGTHNLDASFIEFALLQRRYWNEYHVELEIEPDTVVSLDSQDRIIGLANLNAPVRCRLLYLLQALTLQWSNQQRTLDGAEVIDGSYLLNAIDCSVVAGDPPAEIAFGTGTTSATPIDVALESEYLRKPIDLYSCASVGLSVRATLDGDEAEDDTSEIGVFTAAGILMGRYAFAPKHVAARGRIGFDLEFVF